MSPVPRDEALLNEKVKEWIVGSAGILRENVASYKKHKKIKVLQKWQWFSNYFKNSIINLSEHDAWAGAKSEYLASSEVKETQVEMGLEPDELPQISVRHPRKSGDPA